MGYSREMLERPVVGIVDTGSRLQQLPPHCSRADRGGEARRAGRRRAAARFPTVSLGELFLFPTSMHFRNLMSMDTEEMLRAQPMDAVRADRRLRQDGAGAADGRGLGRHAGGAAGHRPMLADAVPGRAAGRLHRLPALLGALPRRRGDRRTRSARSRASSRPPPAPARVMGTASHHGLHRRGAGHGAAGHAPRFPAVHADRLRAAEEAGARRRCS